MDGLIKKIQNGIESRKFCIIFKNDIEKIVNERLELDPGIRKSIEDFAHRHGWKSVITDSGPLVTFRKMPSHP